MTNKNIFIFILLVIITFGGFLLYYYLKKSKKNKSNNNEKLSRTTKVPFSIKKLVHAIGRENIVKSEYTHIKVKIFVDSAKMINMPEIKKIKTISGTFMTSNSITIIVGNSAKSISTQLNNIIIK